MKDKQELALAQQAQGGELVDAAQIGGMLNQMMGLMQGMAETLRATNERVAVLEKQSALNTKVTPAQAKQINTTIRDKALEVAAAHGMAGNDAAISAIMQAIRRDIRITAGVTSTRELPKCEYRVYMQQLELWDDYKVVKEIKARLAK